MDHYPPIQELLMEKFSKRFWAMVEKADGCWLWTGSGTRYGKMKVAGKEVMAHRISWELEYGPITDGLFVLHRCDTPKCVNPAHLFLGTGSDNTRDMDNKGRRRPHHKGPKPKLTDSQVREARWLYETGEFHQKDIADHYGVSRSTINDAIRGHTWKHVPEALRPSNA